MADTPMEPRHRAARAAREVMSLLVAANASAEELGQLAEDLAAASSRLAGRAMASRYDLPAAPGAEADAYMDTHPLLGPSNPLAPPLRREDDHGAVVITGTFDVRYEGPPGLVHGGFVDFGFEFVLGAVAASTGRRALTGSVTVRYRAPLRVGMPVRFEAKVEGVDGRKIRSRATLVSDGTLCAEAESLHLAVDEATWQAGRS